MRGGTSTCSQELGRLSWPPPLQSHYARYDGFVVIHGTDTMAFAASVLSFVLENLQKTVILTGAQVPPRAPAGQRPHGSGPFPGHRATERAGGSPAPCPVLRVLVVPLGQCPISAGILPAASLRPCCVLSSPHAGPGGTLLLSPGQMRRRSRAAGPRPQAL